MLFGRGQWAVFGVKTSSHDSFVSALSDDVTRFVNSQLVASVSTKFLNSDFTGINPYIYPRLDESLTDTNVIGEVAEIAKYIEGGDNPDHFAIEPYLSYIAGKDDFALGNMKYGFWFILNEYADASDPSSKKEQIAYSTMERPFKFLKKEEKKVVEEKVTASSTMGRKQFPVMLDFQHGRVYAATSNKDALIALSETLTTLGASIFPLVWDFSRSSWPSDFLNNLVKETSFRSALKERADEMSRFHSSEIEKLEDKQMEKIVSNYFAITSLESEIWVGLSTPAKIKMYRPIDPVGVSNPSVAFTLLDLHKEGEVSSASAAFQEMVTKETKTGEKVFRNTLFTLDINENMNIQDAGVAMLRGFDLPQFKKEVKKTLKAKGSISIKDFWSMWIQNMNDSILTFIDNVTDVLEVDKTTYGLVQPSYGTSEVEEDNE